MQLTFSVPTFFKTHFRGEGFHRPEVPVTVKDEEGIRVILGNADDDCGAPDILIERRPKGWVIFLHPDGSEDPSGYLFIKDGGKSFVIPGNKVGCAEPIEFASLKEYDSTEATIDEHYVTQQGGSSSG
jgi:hypothetical protein